MNPVKIVYKIAEFGKVLRQIQLVNRNWLKNEGRIQEKPGMKFEWAHSTIGRR